MSNRIRIAEHQVIKDLSIWEYHKDKMILSSTGLKQLKISTAHFAQYLIFGTESKPHFDFGNAFELAVMDAINGTQLFEQEVAVMPTEKWMEQALFEKPDLKTPKLSKTYQDHKKTWEAENESKYVICDVGEKESKTALDLMVKRCMSSPVIVKLLSQTEYQISLFWVDEETGVKCKTRPDVCRSNKGTNVIVDIKTCMDASPSGFSKQAANLDYPLQAIMQIEGALQSGYMDKVDAYFWLAVEKEPPYVAQLYEFQKDDIEFYWDYYRFLLKRAANAFNLIREMEVPELTGFPGYSEIADNKAGILQLDLPLWYRNYI